MSTKGQMQSHFVMKTKLVKDHDTAVILHVYYPEMFAEIAEYLKNLDGDFDLYVSLPENIVDFAKEIVSIFPNARLLLFENRGRDIAPFIALYNSIKSLGYIYYLKLHTKKSPHRDDGEAWRKDIYKKLIGSRKNIDLIKQKFHENPHIGIVGPKGHVLDYRLYQGANEVSIKSLSKRAGIPHCEDSSFFFVAGTMFWAKPEAFQLLDNLGIVTADFETEPIVEDGALVHALERFIGLATKQAGFDILEVDENCTISTPNPDNAYQFAPVPKHFLLKNINSIVFYSAYQEENASEYLRISAPLRQAGVEIIQGVQDGEVKIERVLDGDAVIFQREFPRKLDMYDQIVNLARQANRPIIYDLDDLLFSLPDNHPERLDAVHATDMMPMLTAFMEADLVTVPTEKLREILSEYNENIIILPNYLDDNLWTLRLPKIESEEGKPLVIGYMGSNSNTPDLELIAPVLMELIQRYQGKIRIQIWGTEPPESLRILPAVTWTPCPSNNYQKFAQYFQTQTADIFIAPLVDNYFNQCKSPLKFFEYSALGVPGVYSHITPYEEVITNGQNGFLASSQEEWTDYLIRLIEDEGLRSTLAKSAQDIVKDKWLLSKNIGNWQDIYERLQKPIFSEKANKPFTVYVAKSISQQQYHAQINSQIKNDQLTEQVGTLSSENTQLTDQISSLSNEKDFLSQQSILLSGLVSSLSNEKDTLNEQVENLSHQTNQLSSQVQILSENLNTKTQNLNEIYASRAWKLVTQYRDRKIKFSQMWHQVKRKVTRPFVRLTRMIRLKSDISMITSSKLFDESYYLKQNPDVNLGGMNPARHYLLYGGFEGRDPSPEFSSNWYEKTYPDVKSAGINPLVHYLKYGKAESRIPKEPVTGQSVQQAKYQPVEICNMVPEFIMLAPELIETIRECIKNDNYLLSLSHDNYLEVTGGVQVYIADEQASANQSGTSYLHIFPFNKGIVLSPEDTLFYIGVNVDGGFVGITEIRELLRALRKLVTLELKAILIHHTMGFTLPALKKILDFGEHKAKFWLHDYFSLCPSYNLLRNSIEYCGAPDANSNACNICNYGTLRTQHLNLFLILFKENDIQVVAPSQFTLSLWRDKFPVKNIRGDVDPPASLKWQGYSPLRHQNGPIRVGFLGYPLEYKGWNTWMRLVSIIPDKDRFKFYHFSSVEGAKGNYTRIPTTVTKEQRLVMVNALWRNQIDVVLLWSNVPETFSFTLHEALAAGCFLLTNTSSGNIQEYINHNPDRGLVLKNEKTLFDLFLSDGLTQKVLDYQKNGKPQAYLDFKKS